MKWCGVCIFARCVVTSAMITFAHHTYVLVSAIVASAIHGRSEIILTILAVVLVACQGATTTIAATRYMVAVDSTTRALFA
jgi:hypothetical protein